MADNLISYDLLGFKVTPTTKEQLLNFIADSIENGEQRIIASQNLHGITFFSLTQSFGRYTKIVEPVYISTGRQSSGWAGCLDCRSISDTVPVLLTGSCP